MVVVVVTHNSADVLNDLLLSIPRALDGLSADVIVVDSASTDGTRLVVGGFPAYRFIAAANRGYAAGINAGVSASAAKGPVVVLNPDVRLETGCLRELVARLEDSGVGIAVPRLTNSDGSLAPSIRRAPTLLRALGLGFTGAPRFAEPVESPLSHSIPHDIDWATGAVMAISRGCHEALDGWDETFFLYSEETDFCLRAADAGYRTAFVPSAKGLHIGGQSGASPRIYTMQIINRVRLYTRRHSAVAAWLFYSLAVVREGVRSLRGDGDSRAALGALLVPRRRPAEIECSQWLLPR